MAELEVLRAGYDQTVRLVEGLGAPDLLRPTPCQDWDVRALLVHVVAATDGLVAMLHDEQPDWAGDGLGDDPAGAVRRSVTDALAAWAEPGATDRPSQQMPGMRLVDFAMGDAIAHAWDLSAALGRPLVLEEDLARVVQGRWHGEPSRQGRAYGAFGPQVEVPADAPALHLFLGDVGRDPQWGQGPTAQA